jgi:hypothetical protein
MADVVNKIIRGTFGRLWLDGELLANIKSFELKATMNYETVQVNGEFCEQQRYTGYSLAGTMTLHKINTFIANKVKDGMKTGAMPNIKLVGALNDVDSEGSERIEVYDVTLDEVTLLKFENNTVGEEEVPFKAGGYKYIDTIA